MLYELFPFQEDFFKVPRGRIKMLKWHLNGPLATSKWHTVLVYTSCWHANRSTTLIYSTWCHINYSCEKLCDFAYAMLPTLIGACCRLASYKAACKRDLLYSTNWSWDAIEVYSVWFLSPLSSCSIMKVDCQQSNLPLEQIWRYNSY